MRTVTKGITINYKNYLSGKKVIRRFGEYSSSIQCVIDDLTNRRGIRIDIHTDTSPKMSDNALGRDLKRVARQLRKTACLNMVYLQNSVLQGHWSSCCHVLFSFSIKFSSHWKIVSGLLSKPTESCIKRPPVIIKLKFPTVTLLE